MGGYLPSSSENWNVNAVGSGLAPGRFVEVEELSSQADRKYYITYVRHVLDEDGYRTYLKAGVNSL